jgi:hypothetical protein
VDAGEVAAQLLADAMRILDQGVGEEVDDRNRYTLGKARPNGPDGGWG